MIGRFWLCPRGRLQYYENVKFIWGNVMTKFGITLLAAAWIGSAGATFAQEQACVTQAERAAMSPEAAALAVLCVVGDGPGSVAVIGTVVGVAVVAGALGSSSGTN